VFSIHCGPLIVVFPQRGYRIKPTNNQKNLSLLLLPFFFFRLYFQWRLATTAARAVAQRVQVAEHTLRRHRIPPYMQDDLAFPATLPSSDV